MIITIIIEEHEITHSKFLPNISLSDYNKINRYNYWNYSGIY